MRTHNSLIPLAALAVCLTVLLPIVLAIPASNFATDKSSYNPGDSGKAMISFTNDNGVLIKITSVSMTFNYFYNDGRLYSQSFTSSNVNMNVTAGAVSQPVTVQFSLPSTIATGYVTPAIIVYFQTLNGGGFSGIQNDRSDAPTPLLIASASAQTTMFAFIATTVLFAALALYFATRYWSTKTPANRARTGQ